MREDAGLVGDDGNPGGTGHTAYHFYLSYLDRTVDINPAKDGKVINGGAGQNDLTFDVYGGSDGTQLLQTGVKDFYQSVNYGTHLKITNIQCPTGYHAKQETYEYNITSDRTGNDAIKAPDITINHYNVVYNANVPNNDMTTKFKVSGKTDTLENCTYGVENTISGIHQQMEMEQLIIRVIHSLHLQKPMGQMFSYMPSGQGMTIQLPLI